MLAIIATPASATSILTQAGQPYTGTLDGALSPTTSALFTTSLGTITCNTSAPRGQITNPGSLGNPAIGIITSIDFTNSGSEACPDDITFANADHVDFVTLDLPWTGRTDWQSDNTAGQPNGTDTFDGARMDVTLDPVVGPDLTCEYVGDFGNTGGGARQVQGDLYNPDNIGSAGATKLDFKTEPFERLTFNSSCPATSTLTATYVLLGQGGIDLFIREAPRPSAPTLTDTDPDSPANENNPEIKGTAQAATTTIVQLYSNSTCTTAIPGASASATAFASTGITVTVNDNSTTTFFAMATNPAGSSPCSATGLTYTEVTPPAILPTPPAIIKCKKGRKLKKGKCVKKKRKKK